MRNIILILFFTLFLGSYTLAQRGWSVGAAAGIAVPNLRGGNDQGYSSRLAPTGGLFVNYKFNSSLSLQLEVDYAGQGAKNKNNYQDSVPSQQPGGYIQRLNTNVNDRVVLNYLEVPILVRYTFRPTEKLGIYANIGPYVGFLLSGNNYQKETSNLYFKTQDPAHPLVPVPEVPTQQIDTTINLKPGFNTVNFGVSGGLGLTYEAGPGYFLLEGRFAAGLTNLQKDDRFTTSRNQTGAVFVTAGYGIHLGRNRSN